MKKNQSKAKSFRIEDYAFLSDTQSGALVSQEGCIDWLCLPRFDSGACFAALLGGKENGSWTLTPQEKIRKRERRYRGDTLTLKLICTRRAARCAISISCRRAGRTLTSSGSSKVWRGR